MTDRPILFSGPMVRALLDGRKTQTRRVLKVPPPDGADPVWFCPMRKEWRWHEDDCEGWFTVPYSTGTRLWVRETWRIDDYDATEVIYQADFAKLGEDVGCVKWRPSIHMPRWASRLTLIVTDVRAQRVQEIGDKDARAEGVGGYARTEFRTIWDDLNADRGFGWAKNPWVCALTFTVHHQNIDQMEDAA